MEAASTKPGRASTARWSGSGKQDGKVYVRNQRFKAPQVLPPARTWRIWAGLRRAPQHLARGTLGPVEVAGPEATMNVCGVVVAMPQGHSWAPNPSNGQE